MDGLIASQLTKHGWEKTSNASMTLKIPVEGADPAAGEEMFIEELQALQASGVTKGIGELQARFSCHTVVVMAEQFEDVLEVESDDGKKKSPKKKSPPLSTPRLPPLTAVTTRIREAHVD